MDIDECLRKVFKVSWKEKLNISNELVSIHLKIEDSIIKLLDNRDSEVRNFAALTIRDMKLSKAIEPLLKAIKKYEESNNIGTLAYALENLNCWQYFQEIFELTLINNFEVQNSALNILDEQVFYVEDKDIYSAIEKLESIDDRSTIEYNWLKSYLEGMLE